MLIKAVSVSKTHSSHEKESVTSVESKRYSLRSTVSRSGAEKKAKIPKLTSSTDDDFQRVDLGLRTLSIPELSGKSKADVIDQESESATKGSGGNVCKRHLSVTQSDRTSGDSWRHPLIHDEEWYRKTQQLFLAIHKARLAESNPQVKVEVTQLTDDDDETAVNEPPKDDKSTWRLSCNRLMSHHSSSDEEWYTEIQQKLAMVENGQESAGTDDDNILSNPPPTRVNTIGETDFCRQTVLDAIHQLSVDRATGQMMKEAIVNVTAVESLTTEDDPSSSKCEGDTLSDSASPVDSSAAKPSKSYNSSNDESKSKKRSNGCPKICVIMY